MSLTLKLVEIQTIKVKAKFGNFGTLKKIRVKYMWERKHTNGSNVDLEQTS